MGAEHEDGTGGFIICHMSSLAVGDRLTHFNGDNVPRSTVTAVRKDAKEVDVVWDEGLRETFPWDAKRSKGYNKVKRLRRQGEVLDWERGTPFEEGIAYHPEAPAVAA
jgi:hypothetical protein